MSILKTKKIFTYLVVGALVIALYVSCKSNEEPTGPKAGTNPPAGEYSSITRTISLPLLLILIKLPLHITETDAQ